MRLSLYLWILFIDEFLQKFVFNRDGFLYTKCNPKFCFKFKFIFTDFLKGFFKAARKEMKESVRRYKLRQSPANLQKMIEVKEKYQTAISEAKLKQYKSNTKFLNESKDSTQFCHRYDKVLGKKTSSLVEPAFTTLNLAYTSLMIWKYQRKSKNPHRKNWKK